MYVSVGLYDSFISCWQEKYRSLLIRPETYIQRYINPNWRPLLETPLFPEHTSGHSVVSTTSATILTALFGENFAYTDSVEVPLGLPPRSYDSFFDASQEAAISRFYGGIHYPAAIELGKKQGRAVGRWVLDQVHTRKRRGVPRFRK